MEVSRQVPARFRCREEFDETASHVTVLTPQVMRKTSFEAKSPPCQWDYF